MPTSLSYMIQLERSNIITYLFYRNINLHDIIKVDFTLEI